MITIVLLILLLMPLICFLGVDNKLEMRKKGEQVKYKFEESGRLGAQFLTRVHKCQNDTEGKLLAFVSYIIQ